jgi:hypothetical protein
LALALRVDLVADALRALAPLSRFFAGALFCALALATRLPFDAAAPADAPRPREVLVAMPDR